MNETGPEAKKRLMLESAARGDFGLKLCEKHYFAHIEGSPACHYQSLLQMGGDYPRRPWPPTN